METCSNEIAKRMQPAFTQKFAKLHVQEVCRGLGELPGVIGTEYSGNVFCI